MATPAIPDANLDSGGTCCASDVRHDTRAASFSHEIRQATGVNPARCYQCGKCSAGCPMADEMPLKPHQMMRLVQLGERDKLLASESVWLCLTCETCSCRCPMNAEPARIIDAVRGIAGRELPAMAPRRIRAFHNSFLSQIAAHGRVFELGLVAAYKMRSGALFADVTAAPGMLMRGKLALTPETIKGVDDVRRIFAACDKESKHE